MVLGGIGGPNRQEVIDVVDGLRDTSALHDPQ